MSDLPGLEGGLFAAVRQSIESDVSATAALREFRAAGGSIGNEAWFSLYGDVRAAIGNRETIQGMDYGAIPRAEQMTEWAAGEAGQQATFVQTYLRVPGQREPRTTFFVHVTDDPHSPQDAIDAAQAHIGEGQRTGSGPVGEVMLGSVVTSVAAMRGRGAA